MKAIETIYNGYRFRSRLEARWAVFFDAVGTEYLYEPQGFELSDGTMYLPDFYLPDLGVYVEIKGVMTEDDEHKICKFAAESGKEVITLGNIPSGSDANDLVSYAYDLPYDKQWQFEIVSGCVYEDGTPCIGSDWPYLPCVCPKCGRFGFEWDGLGVRVCGNACQIDSDKEYTYNHPIIINALNKARQARFEHGESPR